MASTEHTFGAKCRLAPVPRKPNDDGMPPIDAQFFYSSLIPIDDPLSTSSPAGASDSKSARRQLRPFGCGDNNALEKAWLGLMSDNHRQRHQSARSGRGQTAAAARPATDTRALLVQALALQHWDKHGPGFRPQNVSMPAVDAATANTAPLCCSELLVDVSEELHRSFCGLARKSNRDLSIDKVTQDVVAAMSNLGKSASDATEMHRGVPAVASPNCPRDDSNIHSTPPGCLPQPNSPVDSGKENDRSHCPVEDLPDPKRHPRSTTQLPNGTSRTQTPSNLRSPFRPPVGDDGISGKPFVRVRSLGTHPPSASSSLPRNISRAMETPPPDKGDDRAETLEDATGRVPEAVDTLNAGKHGGNVVEVAVGVSRLHKVSLPMLQMKPIYWSPVNDVAVVTRATWFYRDTMVPVAPAVANQLEAGYHELRPWSETWSDEIRCAIDVGPLGEEKVSHWLWPQDSNQSYWSKKDDLDPVIPSDPFCAARCFQGEAAAQGSIELALEGAATARESPNRPFSNYQVIYKDETQAFLLKPSLKPSAYYGRKPVLKVMRGFTVGVPVIRGFDRQTWDRIHDKVQTPNKPGASAAGESHELSGPGVCPACQDDKDRGQVTDLVLVAHGIGQKFAERVESFHFTHAINGFRRAVNIEMGNPAVRQILRKDQNGLMILPLNWRMGLSFEDGGPLREEDKTEYTPESFALKDIEPETIPAVRSMISDVMFDIPFYMSHHKSKMIKALVSEANRVYRLWCRNNPGFADRGRVHLIAHSLGSAMALDILSRQPTSVSRLDLSSPEPDIDFFEFDTRNLFLLGSPAGFFLLLERGALMPRRGRRKPGADPGDVATKHVVGEAGTFGCLAVDNIYNILAKEDPIAYLLNGAVDPTYSTSLKTAYVPSTSISILKSVGDAMRQVVPGMSPAPDPLAIEPERPSAVRLPSQLELEVHDFSREEIAEKKAFLLNDNGQIDWFLRSGGGPLEIQYLNMLSAHSSYWYNQDFIRMLCIEIGRKPGRKNTLPAMRAVKATKRFSPAK
ncbi:Putative phospholipase [Tolypocladium paradoxum]|uniref:Phospholipase n=1 Tax=Tolypocladium paradoxum TaxID=94208 RepID=A0A2S4KV25_9HYPO|nr:Putative phospholipase [Tolypocladium paradoxum]